MSDLAEKHFQRIGELMKQYQGLLDKHRKQELTESEMLAQAFPLLVEMLDIFNDLTIATQQIMDAQFQEISELQDLVHTLTAESNLQQMFINRMGLRSKYRSFLADKNGRDKWKFKKERRV